LGGGESPEIKGAKKELFQFLKPNILLPTPSELPADNFRGAFSFTVSIFHPNLKKTVKFQSLWNFDQN
jgi:hypothetical protein